MTPFSWQAHLNTLDRGQKWMLYIPLSGESSDSLNAILYFRLPLLMLFLHIVSSIEDFCVGWPTKYPSQMSAVNVQPMRIWIATNTNTLLYGGSKLSPTNAIYNGEEELMQRIEYVVRTHARKKYGELNDILFVSSPD
jgi:hypothetical protein